MVKKVVWYVILFIVVQYVALALVYVGNILINGNGLTLDSCVDELLEHPTVFSHHLVYHRFRRYHRTIDVAAVGIGFPARSGG